MRVHVVGTCRPVAVDAAIPRDIRDFFAEHGAARIALRLQLVEPYEEVRQPFPNRSITRTFVVVGSIDEQAVEYLQGEKKTYFPGGDEWTWRRVCRELAKELGGVLVVQGADAVELSIPVGDEHSTFDLVRRLTATFELPVALDRDLRKRWVRHEPDLADSLRAASTSVAGDAAWIGEGYALRLAGDRLEGCVASTELADAVHRVLDTAAPRPPLEPYGDVVRASRPTVFLLQPMEGQPAPGASAWGHVDWPADEAWPTRAGKPLVPLLQAARTDAPGWSGWPEGASILQLLWTAEDDGPFQAPTIEVRWRTSLAEELAPTPEVPPRARPGDIYGGGAQPHYLPRPGGLKIEAFEDGVGFEQLGDDDQKRARAYVREHRERLHLSQAVHETEAQAWNMAFGPSPQGRLGGRTLVGCQRLGTVKTAPPDGLEFLLALPGIGYEEPSHDPVALQVFRRPDGELAVVPIRRP